MVFKKVYSADVVAVFITINSMLDIEAARQFTRVYPQIPIVLVSDSEEYSIEGYRFNTRYYIKRPITQEEICEALGRCAM